MIENEAIKILDRTLGLLHQTTINFDHIIEYRNAKNAAIKALEEVQEYRKIGTVEEVREAVEKTKVRSMKENKFNGIRIFQCPECDEILHEKDRYCSECGCRVEREE